MFAGVCCRWHGRAAVSQFLGGGVDSRLLPLIPLFGGGGAGKLANNFVRSSF